MLTTDRVDRELASRATEVAAISATLIELDCHPGPKHVRIFPPIGVTAQRWEVRARRSKPADAHRVEFRDAVDEIDSLIAQGLAPSQKRLDEAAVAGPVEMATLLAVSATDPHSLTTPSLTTPEVKERVRAIVNSIQQRPAELSELAALKASWPDALANTARQLDALRDAIPQAAQICARAEQTLVTGPLPMHEDAEPPQRATLKSITTTDPAALRALRHLLDAALQVARDDRELAQGLLDRRSELNGRLTAYQAKAARLGLGEDSDLLASGRIAAGLLARWPSDLRAVTRTIGDFQQMLLEKQGKSR